MLMSTSLHGQTTLLLLLHPINGLFSRATWVSRYQKGKTSLDLNEARDDGVLGCSGISWTTCKQSAPRFRQITTPTPHHSIFTGRMLFLTRKALELRGRSNEVVMGGLMVYYDKKVKFSHTRYRALGPELIPVYRQSTRR